MKMIPMNISYSTYDPETSEHYRVGGLDESLTSIRLRFNYLAEELEKLREENRLLKKEHYKDDELRRMKQELDEARTGLCRGFSISPQEAEIIDKFVTAHYRAHRSRTTSFYYTFKPTEIGVFGEITCECCGESHCFQEP